MTNHINFNQYYFLNSRLMAFQHAILTCTAIDFFISYVLLSRVVVVLNSV